MRIQRSAWHPDKWPHRSPFPSETVIRQKSPLHALTYHGDSQSRQLLAVQLFTFVFEDQHRVELIRADVIKAEVYAQLERGPKIQSAPNEESGLRRLRPVEPVERAVVTPVAVVRRVGTQLRVAEFVSAQGPVNQESQGGLVGPPWSNWNGLATAPARQDPPVDCPVDCPTGKPGHLRLRWLVPRGMGGWR